LQLIFIRAVAYFLNPVFRFWLDPCVLRDIMHDQVEVVSFLLIDSSMLFDMTMIYFVQESKTKTVQSLMAASVREMGRPGRMAYLQRIVKRLANIEVRMKFKMFIANLDAFQEMSTIRNKFAAEQLLTMDSKTAFFLEAFDTSNRLLFRLVDQKISA
jgi:hypothetical protein